MNKLIFKKVTAAILLALCSVIYFNCDDSGLIQNDVPFNISGKISNWLYGEGFTLYARIQCPTSTTPYTAASCPIDGNGNFSLNIPATIPDSLLLVPESIFIPNCSGGNAIFNPSDGKVKHIYTFEVKRNDTSKGYIYKGNNAQPGSGNYVLTYMYADRNITATGFRVCNIDTLMFNASLNKGWTALVENMTRADSNGVTYLFNNIEPAGGEWHYSGIW